jgi:hypothetical protein
MVVQQLFLQTDETIYKTRNIIDEVLTSWVLDALRKVFGLEDIRQEILKYFIPKIYHTNILFGKTFGSDSKPTELKKYMESLLKKQKRYILFTASNYAKDGETHYQTFVLDQSSKHLWILDPASVMGKTGIYQPYIATYDIIPFFSKNGYTTEFVKLRNACQTSEDDIFCQTWSLFLQIEFMKRYLKDDITQIILPIPKSLYKRYKYLIAFYKKCAKHVESVCKDLQDIYSNEIKTSPYIVMGLKTIQQKRERRDYYYSFNPCKELMKMNEIDLMVDEQL